MNYFIDTEFIEGKQKESFPISLFRKYTKPTIDLISIGIVSVDNREYYAISKDFNLEEVWNRFEIAEQTPTEQYWGIEGKKVYWLRENVLKPIWREMFLMQECDYALLNNREADRFEKELQDGYHDHLFTFRSMKGLLNKFGKSTQTIADEIKTFIYTTSQINDPESIANWEEVKHLFPLHFYAYYADYDWVVFCWIFGKMMDLPKGFPMYCRDLKQMFDEKEDSLRLPPPRHNHMDLKAHTHYPKQKNEHNALADARWDKLLFEFLKKI